VRTRLSNGLTEDLNNKTRLITRRAYGFHSARALAAMIHLCCGGITLAPPLPEPHIKSMRSFIETLRLCDEDGRQGSRSDGRRPLAHDAHRKRWLAGGGHWIALPVAFSQLKFSWRAAPLSLKIDPHQLQESRKWWVTIST
jgi:hypothetical protein